LTGKPDPNESPILSDTPGSLVPLTTSQTTTFPTTAYDPTKQVPALQALLTLMQIVQPESMRSPVETANEAVAEMLLRLREQEATKSRPELPDSILYILDEGEGMGDFPTGPTIIEHQPTPTVYQLAETLPSPGLLAAMGAADPQPANLQTVTLAAHRLGKSLGMLGEVANHAAEALAVVANSAKRPPFSRERTRRQPGEEDIRRKRIERRRRRAKAAQKARRGSHATH
jgi:hypothetical protein